MPETFKKCLCRLHEVKPQAGLAKFDSLDLLQKSIGNAGGPGLQGRSDREGKVNESRDLETSDSDVEIITEKTNKPSAFL